MCKKNEINLNIIFLNLINFTVITGNYRDGNVTGNYRNGNVTGNYRNGNVTGNVFRLPVNFEH